MMMNMAFSASSGNWESQKNKLSDSKRKSDPTLRFLKSRRRTIRGTTPEYVSSPTFLLSVNSHWFVHPSPSPCLNSPVLLFSCNRSNSWWRPTSSCSSAGRRASKLSSRCVPFTLTNIGPCLDGALNDRPAVSPHRPPCSWMRPSCTRMHEESSRNV